MDEDKAAADLHAQIVRFASDTVEPYKPLWAERREIAKTLISLTSAALIFTITFSSSFISPSTSRFWRGCILACWIAFVFSLASALGSLWFSSELSALPILIDEKASKIKEAAKAGFQTRDPYPIGALFAEGLDKVARQDLTALRLLHVSLAFFGVALLVLTSIGIRQLLR